MEKLPKWQGEIIEPPESLKVSGWNGKDKPGAQHLNWLFNRIYKCLEELQNGGDIGEIQEQVNEIKTFIGNTEELDVNEMTNIVAALNNLQTQITSHLDQKGQPNGYASLSAEGKVPLEQLPPITDVQDATLTEKGVTMLSNAIDSDDETKAATAKAVNALRNMMPNWVVDALGGDPNNPTKPLILTNHANGPVNAVYFYIETVNFGGVASPNYFQIAKGYNRNVVYTRFKYWEHANWSAWSLQYNQVTSAVATSAPSSALPEGYEVMVYS